MPTGIANEPNHDPNFVANWAKNLGISEHAVDLYLDSDVIDLHVDSFIWTRCFGYRLDRRHGPGLLHARHFSQVDIPRLREARISGATWVITTNPWRPRKSRARALFQNVRQLTAILESQSQSVRIVSTFADYVAAKRAGLHAAFLGVQGANAIEDSSSWDSVVDQRFLRMTLMHLMNSRLGQTSTPLRLGKDRGLTAKGYELVQFLNSKRILVDLAHASRRTFDDVLGCHDRNIPPIVTHTGMSAVYRHWRNISDEQLRAIADRGGIIGIFFHSPFLAPGLSRCGVRVVARHIAHAVNAIGASHVSLGSDWDGNIVTPRDMPTCLELPRLVQALLTEGLTDLQVRSVLGGSFLDLLRSFRP